MTNYNNEKVKQTDITVYSIIFYINKKTSVFVAIIPCLVFLPATKSPQHFEISSGGKATYIESLDSLKKVRNFILITVRKKKV